MSASNATLGLFALYLVSVIAIGLWAARRGGDSEEDYFLGGRELSPFAMALSAVTSGRSAWLVLGASAAAWKLGLSALWLFPGYILAEGVMFVTLGPRLRQRSIDEGALTLPEVFERCPKTSDRFPVRPLAGLIIILFLVSYVSAQLVAGGKTLEAVFGLTGNTWGLAITAGIVLVYTLLGGYRAVVLTDVLQAFLLLAGLLVLPFLGLYHVGGWGALGTQLRAIDPELMALSRGWLPLIGGLAIGLGSLGNPHILVRHMTLKDPDAAKQAAFWGTGWNIVMAAGALLMGLVGRALYPEAGAFPSGDVDHLYASLAQEMSALYLFPAFVGLLLATLFAAIMSTCDSQLLVIASSLLRDLRRGQASEEAGMAGSRLTVLVALGAAVLLSLGATRFVFPFVLLSWAALGAAFGPPLILLLYDPKTTRRGLALGLLLGCGVVGGFWLVQGGAITWQLIPACLASGLGTWALRARRQG